MAAIEEMIPGVIVDYDERRGELVIRAKYADIATLMRREYKNVKIHLRDNRPLSDRQRRCCYAMINEISEWSGDTPNSTKEALKFDFIAEMLLDDMDTFSLSNAPMSTVAAFQRYLATFIVRNDIPTRKPMLEYIDDIDDYVYSCLINKKCCICGRSADLHHVDRVGMGRDRDDIIHEGLKVLPLCREHHTEAHTMADSDFFGRYHLNDGIPADKTICRIYKLKNKK